MAPLRWPGTAFALVVFASLASLGSVGNAQNVLDLPDQPTFVVPGVSPQQELRILVYGDMRFTDPSNTKSTNPRARKWLAEKVGTEHADAMLITGDIPFHGSNPQDWAVFEREASSWARGPRVYPTIGNHELRLDWRPGRINWAAAFPHLQGNGFYSVLLGNVFILNLNSTEPIWPRGLQADWLRTQLDHIPEQADFVILQMHIPLIADTQSEFIANIPSPESVVLRRYLETRAQTSRQKFIAVYGHIHNYERFEFNGITHIISGGGGATPYPVFVRGPQDQYRDPAFPVFNYVIMTIHGKRAEGTMYKIADPNAAEYSVVAKDHFVETAK
jgi:Calcineurin-like phosphoesterase